MQFRRQPLALWLMGVIGGIVAVLLVVPQMTRALGGSGTRVTGVSSQLLTGDVVTGVRGESGQKVVLTGGVNEGTGLHPVIPFLVEAPLTAPIAGAAVSTFTPPFAGYKEGVFYGPDTHAFNPSSIPSGEVRAVGSYETSSTACVLNQGMVYLGPVRGSGGMWSTIDVPADGNNVVGHTKACRVSGSNCFVMDTIPHSTMGDLVVGDYDLNLGGAHRAVSTNAFIYNIRTHRWTLLSWVGAPRTGELWRYPVDRRGAQSELHRCRGHVGATAPEGATARFPNELQRTDRGLRRTEVLQLPQQADAAHAL